jgi:uracil phosphoribosyltransferase
MAAEGLRGHNARGVRMVSIVAAPEGVAHLEAHAPEVGVYAAALDRCLNDRKYIVPGLGDFGDRLYGT